jgi:hypothetical protein
MDTAPPDVGLPNGDAFIPGTPRTEHLLEALKFAIAHPGEHRLFRSGKLAGLFPHRSGSSSAAALLALQEGLLETVRTETRGKIVTEWVRATPKAVGFVHDHDSPKSVLRELKELLDVTRAGVPAWMAEAKQELALLATQFEVRGAAIISRLDAVAARVESALRRADLYFPTLAAPVSEVVPWAVDALEYLDQRTVTGATGDCPLPELFVALRGKHSDLTLPAFHDGLRRLNDLRAIRLSESDEMSEPEYAMVVGDRLMYRVWR